MKEKYLGNSKLLGTPLKRFVFQVKDKSITVPKLADDVLELIGSGGSSGSAIKVIDLAQRMVSPSNTITDYEVRTSIFVYQSYNRVSGIARAVKAEDNVKYLLFKVCYGDDSANHIYYIAYTPATKASTWVYNRMITESDDDYAWAMTVFGDVYVDYNNDIMSLGDNVKYQLTKYVEKDVITYTYGTPVISSFVYNGDIPASGGAALPSVSFTQSIVKKVTNSGGTTTSTLTLTGAYEYNSGSGKYSYNNASYAALAGVNTSITFSNGGSTTYNSATVSSTTGIVTAGGTTNTSRRAIITVSAAVTVNGVVSSIKSVSVYQTAAVVATPIITVNPSSLAFTGYIGERYTKNIKVTGANLTDSILVSLTGDSVFSVNVTAISASSATSGYNVSVTYIPTSASELKTNGDVGLITFSSAGASDKQVTLNGRATHQVVATGKYGVSTALPISKDSASGDFNIEFETPITVTGSGRYAWIIVPNDTVGSVTATDFEGDEITVLKNTTNISGHTIYYWTSAFGFTNQSVIFTLHKEGEEEETFYAYYGASASTPSSIDTSQSKILSSSSESVSISTVTGDGMKCHWVAFLTASGYQVSDIRDIENDDISSYCTTVTIDEYTLVSFNSRSNIGNTTKFTLTK